jgi:hypothetical protein
MITRSHGIGLLLISQLLFLLALIPMLKHRFAWLPYSCLNLRRLLKILLLNCPLELSSSCAWLFGGREVPTEVEFAADDVLLQKRRLDYLLLFNLLVLLSIVASPGDDEISMVLQRALAVADDIRY